MRNEGRVSRQLFQTYAIPALMYHDVSRVPMQKLYGGHLRTMHRVIRLRMFARIRLQQGCMPQTRLSLLHLRLILPSRLTY